MHVLTPSNTVPIATQGLLAWGAAGVAAYALWLRPAQQKK